MAIVKEYPMYQMLRSKQIGSKPKRMKVPWRKDLCELCDKQKPIKKLRVYRKKFICTDCIGDIKKHNPGFTNAAKIA